MRPSRTSRSSIARAGCCFFGGPGQGPGELSLPAQVVVDYDNVDYFRDFAAADFEIEYLILVSSQYGPRKVNVFAFGEPRSEP